MRTTVRILTAALVSVATAFAVYIAPAAASITPTDIQKLLASDGQMMGDQLGFSVAMDGSTAVVGAEADDNRKGSAYVYTLSGGVWTQQQKLTASDGAAWDAFGMSVAISGDTVLVGADGNGEGRGAAYVFTRSGGAWTQQQKLTVDNDSGDNFGISVALVGDVALIGAPLDNENKGSAYIFIRSGGVWTQQAELTASDAVVDDRFGWSVDMTGDTIIIGAEFVSPGGAAYVFTGSGSSWTEQQKLAASDGTEADAFGYVVAVYGNTVIVGADGEDDLGTDSGAAYVFTRSGSTWTQQQKLTAIDGGSQDYFGTSVAIHGDMVVVGAKGFGDNVGKAYLYSRNGVTWSEQAQLAAVSAVASPAYLFGQSSALDESKVLVGMPGDNWFKGAAYIFSLPQTTADETPPEVTAVSANDVVYPSDPVVTATATDTDSNVKSADYSFEGGAWTAISATDGAFDETSEGLTGTIAGPLSIGSYQVCVRATDAADNSSDGEDCDTFAVTAASMSVAFSGEYLDLNGLPTTLRATVSGPGACKAGATVEFYVDGGTEPIGSATANTDGLAQLAPVSLAIGVHEIEVKVLSRDFDADEVVECAGDDDTGSAVVADPTASSTGGGWYFVHYGPGEKYKLNFGYTAQRKVDRKTGAEFTTGNVLWISNNAFKLKGKILEGGKLPTCDAAYTTCAAFRGDGLLYERNPDYSPYACSLGETYRCAEWFNSQPVRFTLFSNDGGTSKVCTTNTRGKTTCKESLKPDAFGMQLDIVSLAEESVPTPLNGGNVVVR